VSPSVGDGYARSGSDDARFSDHFGSLESIVTSSAQNDGGLFETNLHDERYLPFEGSGAVSQWQLTLPADVRTFDYATISDVILHVRYTAREGGAGLRGVAVTELTTAMTESRAPGSASLLSVRREFPTEWADFKNANLASGRAPLILQPTPLDYPYWSLGHLNNLVDVEVFASAGAKDVHLSEKPDGTGGVGTLTKAPPFGDLRWGTIGTIPAPKPLETLTLYFDDNTMDDLWLALTWGG
jgi:hypothetical protein